MAKFQRRISRKRYLNDKRVYEYERISLYIPKKHHKSIAGSMAQELDIDVRVEKGIITIILNPKEIRRS